MEIRIVEDRKAYEALPEHYVYRNLLLTHRPYRKDKTGNYASLQRYLHNVAQNPDFDFLRETSADFLCKREKLFKKSCPHLLFSKKETNFDENLPFPLAISSNLWYAIPYNAIQTNEIFRKSECSLPKG